MKILGLILMFLPILGIIIFLFKDVGFKLGIIIIISSLMVLAMIVTGGLIFMGAE